MFRGWWFVTCAGLMLAQVPDVGPFAKTDPAHAFSELKVWGRNGSPLRTAREDWAGAKKRISVDPQWAVWLEERRSEVDRWISKRRDRVEWVAGWWHDFVSPKDGSFLTWTPEEPVGETLSSPSDARVKLTPKLQRAWVFGFRSRHTDKMWEAARLYRLTGEKRYAEWVASQLDFYADHYLEWPVQSTLTKSRLMGQSLDDANVLVRLVNAARLIDDSVGGEHKRNWIEKLFSPEAELLDQTFQRIHNIACWQRSATAQTALYAGDSEMWNRAIDGPFGIRKQIAHGITSEYLWFEQSLGYNSYVVSALLPLFTLASAEGRAGELENEMHSVENMVLAPILMRFPTGQLPNPADSTGGLQFAPNKRLLASVYRVFPTGIGLAEAAKLRNWDTLVDPPEPVAAMPTLPAVSSRSMPSSQMAVLRQGDWQVFLHYGQLNASHAEAEALNYEAFFGATDITHDPGTVGYGSPLHRGFYRTGAAHNVPLVNRAGQDRWRPGELVSFAPGHIIVRQPEYAPGVASTRDVKLDGRRLTDALTVELTGSDPKPQKLGAVLHLQGAVTVSGTLQPVDSPLPYWTETRLLSTADRAVLYGRLGTMNLRITIETPGPFTVTLGRSPDVPPASRDSIYVETTGTKATFRTTMEPE